MSNAAPVTGASLSPRQIADLLAEFPAASSVAADCHLAVVGQEPARSAARARCATAWNRLASDPRRQRRAKVKAAILDVLDREIAIAAANGSPPQSNVEDARAAAARVATDIAGALCGVGVSLISASERMAELIAALDDVINPAPGDGLFGDRKIGCAS